MNAKNFFHGTTEKNSLSYKVGETIKFIVSPNKFTDSIKTYKWIVEGDDRTNASGTSVAEKDKPLILLTHLECPGFVRVRVYACDDKYNELPDFDIYEGGAGADIDKIKCSTLTPCDFDTFWKKIEDDIAETKIDVLKKEEIVSDDVPKGFKAYDVSVKMPYSNPVRGILTYPKNASDGSLKAKLHFKGYGVCGLEIFCEENTVAFTVNAHGIETRADSQYYNELSKEPDGKLFYYGFDNIENSSPDTSYYKNMMARDLMAAKFIKSLSLWNKKDLVSFGGSQGAFQATTVAAHDKNITKLDIQIPWFCNIGGYKENRIRGWAPDYTLGLCYFDTANQAAKVSCPTEITAGLGDYICPPSGIMALYNNLKCKKKLKFFQNKTHSYNCPDEISYTIEN